MCRPAYVKISANPKYHLLLVLQYVYHLITSCAQGMQSLKYGVRHLLQFELEGLRSSQLSCATWDVHMGIGRL